MKRKLLKGVLTFGLAVSMIAGSLYIPEGSQTVQAAESAAAHVENRKWDLTAESTIERPSLEGESGEYDGIQIDATDGKFAPRTPETGGSDTQIGSGTILTIPVVENADGATLTINLSGLTGNPVTVKVNGQQYSNEGKMITISLSASDVDTECGVNFTSQAYLASIELSYNEPVEEYPGTPESVAAEDVTYTFESTEGLLDESGNAAAENKLEENKGTFDGMKVDAIAGKFNIQPDQNRVVINAGTVLYIPAAYDSKGATLLIAGTQDGHTPSEIEVNGKTYTTNEEIKLDMTDASAYPQYLKVEFDTIAYVNTISINYASDSDYDAPDVEAKDKTWDFTESSTVDRPTVEKAKDEFDGIQIDATTGKFAPRTTASGGNDTQIASGTTLYIPVAPDAEGAFITVSGNNYNNLTVYLDGTEITVGKETALPLVESNTYIPLEFTSADGTGSCYLTGITIDYRSDNIVNATTVTVAADGTCDYKTIQDALSANESSAAAPLIIKIAPGTYTEKITVDKPWVSFQPLDPDGEEIIIEESYYSSNTFNSDGSYAPQDDYDLGTDQCGTVLLTSNATGFSATGITFQNSYNVVDHTGEGEQTPAVAFGSVADKVYLKDCKFIGRQDTLYLHGSGSRVQLENCEIEGTVDFIFGDADAYFVNCNLHMAAFAGRDTGYFTAANTKKGNVGFVFNKCTLTVDESYGEDSTVSLGRPWQTECYTEVAGTDANGNNYIDSTTYNPKQKNPTYENTSSAVTFVDCTMDSSIQDARWSVWTRKDENGKPQDVTFHDDVRFAEINSKDAAGNYLTPPDNPEEIVLGTMTLTDNAQAKLDELLEQMGFDLWNPSIPSVDEPENPGTEEPGTTPGGEEPGTGTEEPGTTPGTDDPTNPGQNPGTGNPENPETGDPTNPGQNPGTGDPTNPGQNTGAGTGNENNSGNTGNNGTVNNNGSAQNAAANANVVQTGDTTNVVPYVAALLASVVILLGAVLAIRMRRK